MVFKILVLVLCVVEYTKSQSATSTLTSTIFQTLSSSGFRNTTTITTPRPSTLSFDTLSSSNFRTTTTTANACYPEAKESCKNGATCFLLNSVNFFCLCPVGFTGIDCGIAISTTTRTTTASELTSTTTLPSTTTATTFPTTVTTTVSGASELTSTTTLPSTTTATAFPTTVTSPTTVTPPVSIESVVRCPSEVNICLNGGECSIINGADFSCKCLPSYTGLFCETFTLTSQPSTVSISLEYQTTTITKISCPSEMNICRNNAACFIINNNDLICECKSGFIGKFCEISSESTSVVTTKTTNPTGTTTKETREPCPFKSLCQNEGKCEIVNGVDIVCTCQAGYSGIFCEVANRQPCSVNICSNGGACEIIEGKDIKCQCREGWRGPLCQYRD